MLLMRFVKYDFSLLTRPPVRTRARPIYTHELGERDPLEDVRAENAAVEI